MGAIGVADTVRDVIAGKLQQGGRGGHEGGYGGPGSKTVLPHEAFVKCDIRLVEAMTVEETLAKVKAHVARHAPTVEVVYQGGMEPSKAPLDSPYTAAIQQALRAGQGEEPLLIPSAGGSLPSHLASSGL